MAGAICGIAAKAADAATTRWLSDLGTYPGGWLFALALIGRYTASSVGAMVYSAAFFVASVVAYGVWSTYVLGFGRAVALLVLVALLIVPLMAATASWASRGSGAVPGLVLGGLAGGIVASGPAPAMWSYLRGARSDLPLHWVQALFDVTFALIVVAVLAKDPRTRVWAVIAVLPMAVVAHRTIDLVPVL